MGLKRQIVLALQRAKNQFPGLAAANVERVLLETAMPDDAVNLITGPGTSVQAPGGPSGQRSFWRIAMIEDTAVFAGTGQVTLLTPLPKGAVPLSGHINYDTPIVFAGGATGISFGITGTLNQLAQVLAAAGTAKNTKADNALVNVTDTSGPSLLVTATVDAGTALGTATGTVRVRVIYRYAPSIPNAQ